MTSRQRQMSVQQILRNPFLAFPGILATVALASVAINLLMLTGPFFMLQVYDRVLPSNSPETLVALLVLVVILYTGLGVLELGRSRVLSRMSTRFALQLRETLLQAVMQVSLRKRQADQSAVGDFNRIAAFMGGPALSALFDGPLMIIYLVVLYFIHHYLFLLALVAALLLFAIAVLNHLLSRKPQQHAAQASSRMSTFFSSILRNMEVVRALGMTKPLQQRLHALHDRSLWWDAKTRDVVALLGSTSKALRLFLQSAMLALGAWLVLQQEISAGAMIMGTILLGRALQPVEQSIVHWRGFQQYRTALDNLRRFFQSYDEVKHPVTVPDTKPTGHLEVRELHVAAPGMKRPWLMNINFSLRPGQVLWVRGSNGSGKTMLARALAGVWAPAAGEIRLDGADIRIWPPEKLARLMGYLPQEPQLLAGSIAENICRFDPQAREEDIIEAARRAFVLDAIKAAGGFDRDVGPDGQYLSGGMRQRVALARAFYGNPLFYILDEPFANLDEQGQKALLQALKGLKHEEKTVVLIDHAPLAGKVADLRLTLENGRCKIMEAKQLPQEQYKTFQLGGTRRT